MRACPFCAEQIQDEAKICRFCQREVSVGPEAGTKRPPNVLVGPLASATKLPANVHQPVIAGRGDLGLLVKILYGAFGLLMVALMVSRLGPPKPRSPPAAANAALATSKPTPAPTPVPTPITVELLDSVKEGLDHFAAVTSFRSTTEVLVSLEGLHGMWVAVDRGSRSSDGAIRKSAEAVSAQMVRVQAIQFPRLRRAWTKAAATALWEGDVEVSCIDQACRTVQFVGGVFAANANKKKANDTLGPVLRQLRIKQARFKWIKSEGQYTYWDYDTPKDTEVRSILR
jgi:hypothetical protein